MFQQTGGLLLVLKFDLGPNHEFQYWPWMGVVDAYLGLPGWLFVHVKTHCFWLPHLEMQRTKGWSWCIGPMYATSNLQKSLACRAQYWLYVHALHFVFIQEVLPMYKLSSTKCVNWIWIPGAVNYSVSLSFFPTYSVTGPTVCWDTQGVGVANHRWKIWAQ